MDLRYTENIREKEGGTYGVSVSGGVSRIPYAAGTMTMQFDCDPEKAAYLKSLIYAETEKIMKEAPSQEELDKVVANMKKNHEQSKNHNAYWMSVISNYYITGIDQNDPKNFEAILDNLKPKDIKNYAKKLFKGADVVDIEFVSKQ